MYLANLIFIGAMDKLKEKGEIPKDMNFSEFKAFLGSEYNIIYKKPSSNDRREVGKIFLKRKDEQLALDERIFYEFSPENPI